MRVFLAGASGAIGRPLVRQLVAAGHEVTGMRELGWQPAHPSWRRGFRDSVD
jgi:nucleoside-diphosphate-sugar epimerase